MPVFYSETGSINKLQAIGNMNVSGSGSAIFVVSSSVGPAVEVYDLTSNSNVFQVRSASVDLMKIDPQGNVHISGSVIVTGSLNDIVSLNVSAGSTSNNISQLVFSNANNINFGLNGSTLTAKVVGYETAMYPYFNPLDAYVQTLGTMGSASLFMQPIQVPNVQFDRVAMPIYISKNANANSNMQITLSMRWGLYTRNGSTLSLMTNNSIMTSAQITVSATNTTIYQGIRLITAGITNTLTEGQYYAAMLSNITIASTGAQTVSNLVISQINSSYMGLFGQNINRTQQYTRGLGVYSATTNNLPASIALSQLYGAASATNDANATLYMRQPLFYMVSQTF